VRLSVIIPCLNEEKRLLDCIRSAQRLNPFEVIVVDGGSRDRTVELAEREGARVIKTSRGRGIQLQEGASASKGEILLFLHADSVIKEEIDLKAYIRDGFIGGFFRLRFDDPSLSFRLIEFFANMRSRLFKLPYGDQAIFVKKEVFQKIGGFRPYPFLEDIDLVLRLRKMGKLISLDIPVVVSPRRLKRGFPFSPILLSIRNVIIVLLYILGISPFKLIKLYR
jgi:rSAM/selenodomain-associated transferase 2